MIGDYPKKFAAKVNIVFSGSVNGRALEVEKLQSFFLEKEMLFEERNARIKFKDKTGRSKVISNGGP